MIVIPAKYGSSRTPQKNFRPFYKGLSLLQIAAIRSVLSDNGPVVISSENIEAVKEQLNNIPDRIKHAILLHDRPQFLSKDPSTILDVLDHYLQSIRTKTPKSVAVVLPTSPFNSVDAIRAAHKKFHHSSCHKLLSVSPASTPPFNAWIDAPYGEEDQLENAFPENPYKLTQSTSCPISYFSNGCISLYSVDVLMTDRVFKSTIGYKMSGISGIDIDFEYEFDIARTIFPRWCKDLDQISI